MRGHVSANVVVGAIGARASHTWATLCLNPSHACLCHIGLRFALHVLQTVGDVTLDQSMLPLAVRKREEKIRN